MRRRFLLASGAFGLAAGVILIISGRSHAAGWALAVAALPAAAQVAVGLVRSLLGGRLGADAVALETCAEGRATRALTELMPRAPRRAARIRHEVVEGIDIAELRPGALVLVRRGGTVPADGRPEDVVATLDESAPTGEPMPVELGQRARLLSAGVNAGGAFRRTERALAEMALEARRGRRRSRPAEPSADVPEAGARALNLSGRRDGQPMVPESAVKAAPRAMPLPVWLHGAGNGALGTLRLLENQARAAGVSLLVPESRAASCPCRSGASATTPRPRRPIVATRRAARCGMPPACRSGRR